MKRCLAHLSHWPLPLERIETLWQRYDGCTSSIAIYYFLRAVFTVSKNLGAPSLCGVEPHWATVDQSR